MVKQRAFGFASVCLFVVTTVASAQVQGNHATPPPASAAPAQPPAAPHANTAPRNTNTPPRNSATTPAANTQQPAAGQPSSIANTNTRPAADTVDHRHPLNGGQPVNPGQPGAGGGYVNPTWWQYNTADPNYSFWNYGWYSYNDGNGYGGNQSVQDPNAQSVNSGYTIPDHAVASGVTPPTPSPNGPPSAAAQNSRAYRAASEQLRLAQAQYDAAVQRVTDRLSHDPQYSAAQQRKSQEDQVVSTLKASASQPSVEAAAPASTAKLAAAKQVTDIQREAIAADPAASAAKAQLDAAAARLQSIR